MRFRQGDRPAFAELVHRWESALGSIAYRITHDAATAEDVRQTVFLQLLKSQGDLRKPEQVAVWLRRCVLNVALTEVRRRSTHRRASMTLARDHSDVADAQPGEAMAAAEEAALLRNALMDLEPDQRALLSLRFDEGLTFREIADTVGRPVSTVKSQICAAIRRLRTMLTTSQKE